MEPLLTSDEVAAYLRVDVVTIRRLVNRGELPAYRIGGEYRFMKEELEAYLKGQRVAGEGEGRGDPVDALAQLVRKFFAGGKLPIDADFERRFTRRAFNVLQLAQEEAQRLNHHYMGTEHLLLGLVREGGGVGAQVLESLGIQLGAVRSEVEVLIKRGERPSEKWRGMTQRVNKVLWQAVEEASRLNHQFIGTEHLLLGLLDEGEGIGVQVLKRLGVDLEVVREKTIELVRARHEETPPALLEGEASPVSEGEEALTCARCGARSPAYFQYCFRCGVTLAQDN
ncbi:MAG TPA: Clp protease N-terminal domain-containing protein [Ktedonobacterales bacterium]